MLFAPDGSKVHELEHDAGGVNTVVIAKVVIVCMVEVTNTVVAVAVTAVAASLMLASTLSDVKIHHQEDLNGPAPGKRGSLCTDSISSPSPTARLLVLILSFLTFTMLCF
jgi:hypothetical protein